ncbi:hypothetical protein [Alicyclobacillus macrosporangiidus]|uniref:hypothetical protein n=1 Tax=Alicyclobacillus macrosporangiidus TaxID=392015 RepID=UPI0012DF5036|nr:hypothetical protein [Alicyclobacillus macrosporangiidus]
MPASIKMYKIVEFPNQLPVESAQVSPGIGNVTFITRVTSLGRSEYPDKNLEKWQIRHDIGEEFRGKGYIEDGSQYDIVAVSTSEIFPCFVEEREFLYTSGTKRTVSEQALRRLRRYPNSDNKLIAQPVRIDLIGLKDRIKNNEDAIIRGGWFRGMQIENVEVAYLGGGSVVESDDWDRYENSGGTISALRLDFPTIDVEEESIKILITRDGNCVVYRSNITELHLLQITMPLFDLARGFLEA